MVTIGASSFGTDLVSGRKRVPRPAAGISGLAHRAGCWVMGHAPRLTGQTGPVQRSGRRAGERRRQAGPARGTPAGTARPDRRPRSRRPGPRSAPPCSTRSAAHGWRTVAAYVPLRTEPGSLELLDALVARRGAGARAGDAARPRPRLGARCPATAALGVDAIGRLDAVLVPALAVAADGTRLGRGGGSYDRALARVPPGRAVVALLYDGEVRGTRAARAVGRAGRRRASPRRAAGTTCHDGPGPDWTRESLMSDHG